jgi:hypothetical protein
VRTVVFRGTLLKTFDFDTRQLFKELRGLILSLSVNAEYMPSEEARCRISKLS